MIERKFSRRDFLEGMVKGGAAIALGGCTPRAEAEEVEVPSKRGFVSVEFDSDRILSESTIGEIRKRSWDAVEFQKNSPGFELITEQGSNLQIFYELLDKDGQNIEAFYLGIKPEEANLAGDTGVPIFTKQTNGETLYSLPWINTNDAVYRDLYPAVVTREENGQRLLLRAKVDSSGHVVFSEPFFWKKLPDGCSVRINVKMGKVEIFDPKSEVAIDGGAGEYLWRPVSEKIIKNSEAIGLPLETVKQLSEAQVGLLPLPVALNKNGETIEEAYLLGVDSRYWERAYPVIGINVSEGKVVYAPIKSFVRVESAADRKTGEKLQVIKFYYKIDNQEEADLEIITTSDKKLLIEGDEGEVELGTPLLLLENAKSVTSGCQFPVVIRRAIDGVLTHDLDKIFLKDEEGKFVYLG